jgi:hypothetical protein
MKHNADTLRNVILSCDSIREEPQHPSFLLMTMPGWTFINVYAHDRDPRDPAIEGLQGG